jgi:PEGA domain/PKD domain
MTAPVTESAPAATLSVASDPAGATVYVDGEFAGQTPLEVKNLQAGDHRVRLVKDGYLENGRVVTVGSEKTHRLHVRLTARTASAAVPERQSSGGITSGSGDKKWLWIGLAGGAAAVTAVVLASRNHAPALGAVTAEPSTGLAAGSTIVFTASASDDDGDSLTYAWDFGDGGTASGMSATHVYNTAGTFTATVRVGDGKTNVSGTAAATIRSVSGTWRGTLEGSLETFVFTQSAGSVTGTLTDAFGQGTVLGTVTPTPPRVRLTITQPPFSAFIYTADPNADVNTLTGFVNGLGFTNVVMTLTRQ